MPADLSAYGRVLAGRIGAADEPVDLLVGLSVGAQAATVAAAACGSRVRRLMLVSPTVDPATRTAPALLGRWLFGGRVEPAGMLREQLPDWRRAGPRRLLSVLRSALAVRIEALLPTVTARLTVVHTEHDLITSHSYAAELATAGELVVVPGATHSWPYRDGERFADLVEARLG